MISWQYLAGMIDADGSIGTTRTGKYRNVIGRVVVVNTNHDFLRLLKEQFGGYLTLGDKGQKENWKPFGCITWTNRKAEVVLQEVLPFLIIKQKQAKLVLELIRMKNLPKSERFTYISRSVGSCAVLRDEIMQREIEIADSIKALNKKGV